jgi:acyl-CoA synthetase (NDP forming)
VPPFVTAPTEVATAIAAAATNASSKPVAAVFMQAVAAPAELGPVPAYQFPEAATRAMARAAEYGTWRQRPDDMPALAPATAACHAVVDRALARGGGWLPPDEVAAVLAGVDIRLVRGLTALDESAAATAAQQLGYPVALKAVGASLLHKSDVGGVRLDLRNGDELRAAARAMRDGLGTRLEGFLVQPMVPAGLELLVGSVEDASFGPVVLCSLGGTLVEALKAPVARLAPLTPGDIDDLLRQMPGHELLGGYRGAPPADLTALRALLERVSSLVTQCPEIVEMDLNPVRVFADGLCVIDARVRVGRPPARDDRRITY